MDELTNLLGRNGFLPHGYCFQWSPGLLWSMVSADLSIAMAYFSLPLAIGAYVRKRPSVNLGGMATLFSLFIFACGVTHLLDVWTIWRPDYPLHASAKVVTAVVSVLTAVMAWRLLPRAVAIPSVDELRQAVAALKAEVERRRSAEGHLLEIEQSLAATLATIDAAFITTDAQGQVTRMNAVAERITGWPAAEGVGNSVWDVFDRIGRDAALRQRNPVDVLLERGMTASTPRSVVCVARDGTETPVELHAQVTRNADGAVRGMTVIFRDVARLTTAQADVRRLAAAVESSHDAIIVKSLDGRITDWNAAAERMFGYGAEQAVGRPVQMLIPPERQAEEMRILADLAHGTVVPPLRTVRLARDGRRIEVSLQVSPLHDAAGRVVGGVTSARDLTHQRQIESALRQSEARLRFALESAAIGDWELDAGTGEIHRSSRCDACFGHVKSPSAWTRDDLIASVHDDDRAAAAASLQEALATESPWHAQFRIVWPDGSVHWLRMDARPTRDPAGDLRLVGIVSDVTAVHLAERAREQAQWLEAENRRVQESSRMKSQFLANMSHELRTPLNAVIGFADLLHRGAVPPDSPKFREYLGHIGNSGRHLLQIINDVLDLSKIEAGKLEFTPEPVDLERLVGEVVGTVGVQALARRHEIVSALDPALHDLHLDPSRLKQVLFNYLSNAIKFTPPGGRIVVRALAEGPDLWRLEVQDNGAGIALHDQPRLFVEFQQLDPSLTKRHQGTGLGLALTRRLVEAQHGRVGVHSVPEQGSCFYAVLPRRHDDAAAAIDGERPRMLVAVRDPTFRDGVARELAIGGLATDAAGTVADVLRLARVRRYTGLALDLSLSDGTGPADGQGLQALADLRAGTASAGAAVRALGMSVPGGGALALPVGDVLSKPLQDEELARAIEPLRPALLQGGVVLVVDDDPLARSLMQAALAGIGVRSAVAPGGAEALAMMGEVRPVAVVLDLMMPGINGFEVLHALRRDADWRPLPVYIWTALSLTPSETQELARSVEAIVAKGDALSLDAVLEALGAWAQSVAPSRRAQS